MHQKLQRSLGQTPRMEGWEVISVHCRQRHQCRSPREYWLSWPSEVAIQPQTWPILKNLRLQCWNASRPIKQLMVRMQPSTSAVRLSKVILRSQPPPHPSTDPAQQEGKAPAPPTLEQTQVLQDQKPKTAHGLTSLLGADTERRLGTCKLCEWRSQTQNFRQNQVADKCSPKQDQDKMQRNKEVETGNLPEKNSQYNDSVQHVPKISENNGEIDQEDTRNV